MKRNDKNELKIDYDGKSFKNKKNFFMLKSKGVKIINKLEELDFFKRFQRRLFCETLRSFSHPKLETLTLEGIKFDDKIVLMKILFEVV